MDDGLFDVLIVKPSCVVNLVPVFKGLPYCSHLNSSLVEYYKCESLEIVGRGSLNLDGINVEEVESFKVSVRRNAIRLLHHGEP